LRIVRDILGSGHRLAGMKSPTGRKWNNPAKEPAKPETLSTPGDFGKFTDNMRTMLKAKPEKKHASPAPTLAS
jgi:hypothetical protein